MLVPVCYLLIRNAGSTLSRDYHSSRGLETLSSADFLRAAGIWARLEQWLLLQGTFGSNLQSSLNQGLLLQSLPWPGDVAVKSTVHASQALLAFYGGQIPPSRDPWRGLFGGYSAYHYMTSTWFVGGNWDNDGSLIEIGMCPLSRPTKTVVVNSRNGLVEYNSHPNLKICPSDQEDAVLDWFNEYVTRLETGFYQRGGISGQAVNPGRVEAVLQFPRLIGRGATRAVTRGVEVTASAVYSPITERMGFTFVYSIRLRLLEPNDEGYDVNRPFSSCQLKSRHWQLGNRHGGTDFVDGDGVIGFYPILRERSHRRDSGTSASSVTVGEEVPYGSFQYESCTDDSATSFGGYMLFVPGTLANPGGPPFEVHLAPLPLNRNPQYQY